MLFEGAEKKAEILIDPNKCDLSTLPKEYWVDLVAASGATILSTIANGQLTAYLLSESSLFVWPEKILMITCGETVLVNSIEKFINDFGLEKVRSIIYQRKNEYFGHRQKSSFSDDIELLKKYVPGKALRFGNLDSHHTWMFHWDSSLIADPKDLTLEVLMYHIKGKAGAIFRQENQTAQTIREFLNLEALLPGFTCDDFVFSPFGYSINGIRGREYFTIHVTPEEFSSYVSFETNINLNKDETYLVESLVSLFNPESFDTVTFNHELGLKVKTENNLIPVSYHERLDSGYEVMFNMFQKIPDGPQKAITL